MCAPFNLAMLYTSGFDPILYAGVGAPLGVYLFYRGFRMLQRKRLIMNTPQCKIRSAAMGLVEVSGLATGPYTITAPVTQHSCFYYRTLVWELKESGKSNSWQKAHDESLHTPFFLDDNTGKLLVDPTGADMELHCDFKEEFRHSLLADDAIPASVARFLVSRAIITQRPLKVEEYCLKPKNAVFALGTLAQNPGIEVSIRVSEANGAGQFPVTSNASELAGAQQRNPAENVPINARSTADGLTFNSTHGQKPPRPEPPVDDAERRRRELFTAGLLGVPGPVHAPQPTPPRPADEAEKHRRELVMASLFGVPMATGTAAVTTAPAGTGTAAAPAKEALPAELQSPLSTALASGHQEFDLYPPVVLMKGKHNPHFFISWRSEREVISELGWKSALYIWGGPALTLACVALVLMHLGLL